MQKIIPAILCGGSGTRLWPLSRENHPKQFVDMGNGRTLFKDTLARLGHIANIQAPICVCNEKYRFYAIPEILALSGQMILEPSARNTAAAVCMAALMAKEQDPEAALLILPADHYFSDAAAFGEAIAGAAPLAAAGQIVTFGITPNRPATGFGYIAAGQSRGNNCFEVAAFVEKPQLAQAEAILQSGGHFWNAGIFMAMPDVFTDELAAFRPDIYEACQKAFASGERDDNIFRPQRQTFTECPSESWDYAVMEHTKRAVVAPLDCLWNDLGSWEAFYENSLKDEAGNVLSGSILADDASHNYIHSTGRLIAAIGISNLAIIETPDAVLVANRGQVQQVRNIVNALKEKGAKEYREHRLTYRPWGSYEILSSGDRFQVKRIIVDPGQTLSLQMHHHRAEHWIVVSGTAEVTNGEQIKIFTENQSTYIPVGTQHRLRNPGLIPLVIIEIQSGSYLGEDDIVRLQDGYDRRGGE